MLQCGTRFETHKQMSCSILYYVAVKVLNAQTVEFN